jgi:predicted aspartyl protease
LLAAAAFVAAAHTTTVPVDDIAGLVVVAVMVNGKGPFHFALDTGSATVVITPQFALQLALQLGEPEAVNEVGDQRTVAEKVDLASVSIGDATQPHVDAAVLALPPYVTYQGRYGTIDGLVGYSFLKNYAVSLDLVEKRMSLTPSAGFAAPPGAVSVPMAVSSTGMPVIAASIDGATGRFLLDTGTQGSIVLTSPFADAHSVRSSTETESSNNGIGGSISSGRALLATVTLGTATLHDVPAELLTVPSRALQGLDGVIGYGVLRRFTVVLDYARGRVLLEPSVSFDAYRAVVGTGIEGERHADGTIFVLGAAKGSPAARAGVEAGETVVAIDGRDVTKMSNADYEAAVGTSPGTSAVYTLRSGNTRHDVTLQTIDLLPPVGPR